MAIKPTIYKAKIALSDVNRNFYDCLNLTLAKHPSETPERMMVRLLAFCINAEDRLSFTKGLSSVEEPDVWAHTLDDQISLWIDVGEPSFERIKKASRISAKTKVYCFNLKSSVWWDQNKEKFKTIKISAYQFQWQQIQTLANLVQRNMDLSVTITGDSAYIAGELGECEILWTELQN